MPHDAGIFIKRKPSRFLLILRGSNEGEKLGQTDRSQLRSSQGCDQEEFSVSHYLLCRMGTTKALTLQLCEEEMRERTSSALHPPSTRQAPRQTLPTVKVPTKNCLRILSTLVKQIFKSYTCRIHFYFLPQPANRLEAYFSNEQLFPDLAWKVPAVS